MDNNNLPVSICILTFNRCLLLRKLLKELETLTYLPLEIIVVDNCSEDETQSMMRSDFQKIIYIRNSENIGAAGRNVGIKAANGDIIFTLDDDILGLDDEAIQIIVRMFIEDVNLGAITFRYVDMNGRTCDWVHHCVEEDYRDKEFMTYEILEGAVAFRKKALELSGYYPESFFLSHEGPDLAFRILDKGFKVIYSGQVKVKHLVGEGGRKAWRNYYYDTRNQLWLAARNFPLVYSLIYLGRGLSSMLVYSIRDGYTFYWLKAIMDGLKGMKQALKERSALTEKTMNILKEIDSKRPSLSYMIKKRLMAKDNWLIRSGK